MKDWITGIFLASIAVLSPIHSLLIATGFLIFVDLVLGIWSALKQKHPITSAGLRRTVSKFFVYQTSIISGFVIQTFFIPDLPVVKLISATIGLVEIKSILENLNIIYGDKIFKSLIKKIGSDNDK